MHHIAHDGLGKFAPPSPDNLNDSYAATPPFVILWRSGSNWPKWVIACEAPPILWLLIVWSFEPIREAVKSGRSFDDIQALIAAMISRGVDRDTIFAALTDFRIELQAAGDEALEDVVLELMDCLVGWCGPSARL